MFHILVISSSLSIDAYLCKLNAYCENKFLLTKYPVAIKEACKSGWALFCPSINIFRATFIEVWTRWVLCRVSFVCLCWGLTSQSTIFQSCRDGATASWVINQYFRGVKCLAQGHNTAAVGIEPPTSRSGSDTLPLSHRAPLQSKWRPLTLHRTHCIPTGPIASILRWMSETYFCISCLFII